MLAVGTRLLAERLRLPAIVLLLPVGFAAGAMTSDLDPNNLFAGAFQPMVSLGVGIILFEAGIRLRPGAEVFEGEEKLGVTPL